TCFSKKGNAISRSFRKEQSAKVRQKTDKGKPGSRDIAQISKIQLALPAGCPQKNKRPANGFDDNPKPAE
ncbi:MAG TPA: hypothetical protein VFX43_01030, partial [Chitinophagaceae bacterium]|nr:hypothetical protein [Chitinophagaceae bacterium]